MAVLAVISAVGIVVDDRVLVDSPIWSKPFKFSVSFVAFSLALAWMLSLLTRARRAGWWAGTVVAGASLIEMIAITGQVVRGKRSHFNQETPFDSLVFNVMGASVVVLWTGTLVIALLLFRARIADRASAWAVRLGAVLALVGAGIGFLMTRPTPEQAEAAEAGVADVIGAHSVGVADGGPSMPLTGWSTTGGDLRIPHFFGMHALQVLPFLLLALLVLAPRFARLRDERIRLRLVLVASGTYAAVLALLIWQALRGQPLIHPDGATLGAAAVILVGCAVGVLMALRTPPASAVTDVDHGKELVA
ncbi:hypothetical protein OG883_29695 [Streptomyces sp. NBC_01142]|uniref:hypothetical protein n=1 Tax=Streptomyces sp. NBC_01142 TaxID=2975865 RepID=UPI002251943C|nr:hypothetical protein [Streptomyces sp. NBC_01142]MCX4823976.1 hypothetical protein [Streptomyces sp. NBC_01142]